MELTNTFVIDAPLDDVWSALNDPELVAPCFPGAALTSYTGDSFAGIVKVKLGPVSLKYQGKGTYVERRETSRIVVIEAQGRDTSGNGSARAVVTGSLAAESPDRTKVTMVTDLDITGRPAQFGRGLMSSVADKIIGQFAVRLADELNGSVASLAPPSHQEDSLDLGRTVAAPAIRASVAAAGMAILAVLAYLTRRRCLGGATNTVRARS